MSRNFPCLCIFNNCCICNGMAYIHYYDTCPAKDRFTDVSANLRIRKWWCWTCTILSKVHNCKQIVYPFCKPFKKITLPIEYNWYIAKNIFRNAKIMIKRLLYVSRCLRSLWMSLLRYIMNERLQRKFYHIWEREFLVVCHCIHCMFSQWEGGNCE